MHDQLEQLSSTVVEHSLCHLALPWVVADHLVLNGDVVDSEVEAKGHIIANGSAEHCRLESALGSVFLLYGSMAYTKIQAAVNIYVKHSANSALTAGHDIIIEKSVVASVLRAGRRIISESGDATIVGGRVEAALEIAVHGIGHENQTETVAAVLSPRGRICFTRVFPGTHLKIGDAGLVLTQPGGAGAATLREGRIHVEWLEAAVGAC